MRILGAENAVVDIRKLRDYCLNRNHDEGKHKARLFAAVGITVDDAEVLRDFLLQGVKNYDAQVGKQDVYGQRYIVDVPVEWDGKQLTIRSGWIIEHGGDTPRLTTCYPL